MIEEAKKYNSFGLSMIPIDKHKIPIGLWKERQNTLLEPNWTSEPYGIGIVCGKISNNLEVIDIDCKYDLTGKLFSDYKNLIAGEDIDLLKKLVVQKTTNDGYHFFYKCDQIEGNKKLARREASQEEKSSKNEKFKVLIETRGEGGYVATYPTPGYSLIYGSFDSIQTISSSERETLFSCARLLNQEFDISANVSIKKQKVEQSNWTISPLDDFNERGDILQYLINDGWKQTGKQGSNILLLRPGGEKKWSASYHEDKRLFYVFTQSTEFECDKAYNPANTLAIMKFNKDFSETSKYLLKNGFGKSETKNEAVDTKKINDECSFLANNSEMDSYLEAVRSGSFKMGFKVGIPELDEYFRLKEENLIIVNGMDNVGKSTLIWYLAVLSGMFHDWKWAILSAENKIGGIKKKLMEFYLCKSIKSMSESEYLMSKKWVEDHFFIIANDELYSYQDLLKMAKIINDKHHINYCLIDPYNALIRESENFHEHDYKAISEMRLFIKKTGCGIFLNCHAVTGSLRREYAKDHKYAGFPYPPGKADTEGGGKFSNKADDFITCHRLTQHPHEWMIMQLHIRKIKEMETGGRPTMLDEPVLLEMVQEGVGFRSVNSQTNPVINYWNSGGKKPDENKAAIQPSKDWTIPTKEEVEEIPF